MAYNADVLRELIQREALEFGNFTLSSGKSASFYLDCRKVTLDAFGANQIALGMLQLMDDWQPDAVGGMAVGADPITGAIITIAGQHQRALKGFIVRKESKAHGTGQRIEGPVRPGMSCVIVEDVVTTGGSALQAIECARQFGMTVVGALAIVDRLAGGQEAFAQIGVPLRTLFTIGDLGVEQTS